MFCKLLLELKHAQERMFDANASSAGSKVQVTFHRSRVQVIAPSINYHTWIQTRDISTPAPPPKKKRASIQIQGCALALPSSQWYLTFALIQRQGNLSFVITTMCWTPWIELDSFQFFLKYSVKGFWNLFAFGIQNPANFRCGIPNPGLWNLEYSRRNPECH